MPNREKVIKELECCIYSEEECECPEDCPYSDGDMGECQAQVMRDALALLKEQNKRYFLAKSNGDIIPLGNGAIVEPNGYLENENGGIAEKPVFQSLGGIPWRMLCGACKRVVTEIDVDKGEEAIKLLEQFKFCPWCGKAVKWE